MVQRVPGVNVPGGKALRERVNRARNPVYYPPHFAIRHAVLLGCIGLYTLL